MNTQVGRLQIWLGMRHGRDLIPIQKAISIHLDDKLYCKAQDNSVISNNAGTLL